MEKVFQYIDQHQDVYIKWLQEACQQPSVSVQNIGMEKMADMVREYLQLIEAYVEMIETPGYPIIYGEILNNKPKTLSFYNHYDVQPEDPIELWESDPYGAEIRDGILYARGSADNKGNLMARICAVHAYKQVYGELPVNLKFIFEGEEEVGSPNLTEFATLHPDKLQTDGIVWEGGIKNEDGELQIGLGAKGMCYVELRVKGAITDVHSSEAPIVVNPAWRLVWALSTLKNEKEEILIEGFNDQVKPLTAADSEIINKMSFNEEKRKEHLGLDQFLLGVSGNELKEKLLAAPTCTICGIVSGYTGPGSKTVLPAVASAKLDFRLVPNQDPAEIMKLLRKHLDAHGFSDVEVVSMSDGYPFNTDPTDSFVNTVIESAKQVYEKPPSILRNLAGTSPMYKLCHAMGIPAVQVGVANENSNYHAPNENIHIKDYIDGIKLTVAIIHELDKS